MTYFSRTFWEPPPLSYPNQIKKLVCVYCCSVCVSSITFFTLTSTDNCSAICLGRMFFCLNNLYPVPAAAPVINTSTSPSPSPNTILSYVKLVRTSALMNFSIFDCTLTVSWMYIGCVLAVY